MNQNMEKGWNYNMESCPLDTEVRLLSSDGCPLLPQREYVGTVTHNGKSMVNGECHRGETLNASAGAPLWHGKGWKRLNGGKDGKNGEINRTRWVWERGHNRG